MGEQPNQKDWFEFPVSDFARAYNFYKVVFDLELSKRHAGSTTLASVPKEAEGTKWRRVEGMSRSIRGRIFRMSLYVNDIDATLLKITELGGKLIGEIIDFGESGILAHFVDSEDNLFDLFQAPKDNKT